VGRGFESLLDHQKHISPHAVLCHLGADFIFIHFKNILIFHSIFPVHPMDFIKADMVLFCQKTSNEI